jgi:[acyl-carrier-protein] S-malonyltransferase
LRHDGECHVKLAMMFPGQGSQSVGMLATLAAAAPVARRTFDEASAVLGYESLAETERTQPAMLAAGVAAWRTWQERGGPVPAALAGHSLGEYTALVCAGAFDYAAAVELVRFRGQAMQRAVPAGKGAMAAILGLEDSVIESICDEVARGDVVQPVNYNSPGQLVIAGEASAVARAVEACRARGAKRAVTLPVSVPSHSALMKPAADELRLRLGGLPIHAPSMRVFAFDAGAYDTPAAIRDGLYRQLFNPVRWSAIVAAMIGAGVTHLFECGPGKVLTGLARRAPGGRELQLQSIESPESLEAALAAAAGSGKA